jgi:hypothetical protein
VYELADAYSLQIRHENRLTSSPFFDKKQLLEAAPSSLKELKNRISQLMRTPENSPKIVVTLDHAFTDPNIITAVNLGKRALKDQYLMTLLWNTFKNQSRIAQLLKVDRSSVHRRCKLFNLGNL